LRRVSGSKNEVPLLGAGCSEARRLPINRAKWSKKPGLLLLDFIDVGPEKGQVKLSGSLADLERKVRINLSSGENHPKGKSALVNLG